MLKITPSKFHLVVVCTFEIDVRLIIISFLVYLGVNALCLVLSHNYVITINQYLNQCLHLVLFACILSVEKQEKRFIRK